MSHFEGDDGKVYNIFGADAVEKTAKEFKKKFLGKIPIEPEVGKANDNGIPIVENDKKNIVSKIFLQIAKDLKSQFID